MRALIDTHAFLWMLMDDAHLTDSAREALLAEDSELFFSMASFWEIAIKCSIGKLELAEDWPAVIKRELSANSIRRLPILDEHCVRASQLPFHHRDPFDRMLIAQALEENLSILSKDIAFADYGVPCLW